MSSAVIFAGLIVLVAYMLLRWRIGDWEQIQDYFDQPGGRKIRNGILIFCGVGILAAIIGVVRPAHAEPSWRWAEYGEVYLGLDYTFQELASPCRGLPELVETPYGLAVDADARGVGADGRLTSNGGFRMNILQSPDRLLEMNAKYTHHSCALRGDRELYDAVGLELTYRLW